MTMGSVAQKGTSYGLENLPQRQAEVSTLPSTNHPRKAWKRLTELLSSPIDSHDYWMCSRGMAVLDELRFKPPRSCIFESWLECWYASLLASQRHLMDL